MISRVAQLIDRRESGRGRKFWRHGAIILDRWAPRIRAVRKQEVRDCSDRAGGEQCKLARIAGLGGEMDRETAAGLQLPGWRLPSSPTIAGSRSDRPRSVSSLRSYRSVCLTTSTGFSKGTPTSRPRGSSTCRSATVEWPPIGPCAGAALGVPRERRKGLAVMETSPADFNRAKSRFPESQRVQATFISGAVVAR